MTPDLATTNVLLGVLAAVSVFEALAVLALCVGGFLFYRRVMQVLGDIEVRQVAPVATRANAILEDINSVTSLVKGFVERIDPFVRWGIGSVRREKRDRKGAA